MYNYRGENLTDQDILIEVYNFCFGKHSSDELFCHINKTLNGLFALHECTLFHQPVKLDESVWKNILAAYINCFLFNDIEFPERPVIGPVYDKIGYLNGLWLERHKTTKNRPEEAYEKVVYRNFDRRITQMLPYFFGITYLTSHRDYDDRHLNMEEGKEHAPILIKHRMLYDILYNVANPDHRLVAYRIKYSANKYSEVQYRYVPPSHPIVSKVDQLADGEPLLIKSKKEFIDLDSQKLSNSILGNLAKPSIFRFDSNARNSYYEAFDYIRKELIYRFAGTDTCGKLKTAMCIEKFTSQMRSLAFSITDQLTIDQLYTRDDIDKKYRCTGRLKPYYRLCETILDWDTLYKKYPITIFEYHKYIKEIDTILMNIKDVDAILYYAYAFFYNLPTSDYIQECIELLSANDDVITDIIVPNTKGGNGYAMDEYTERRNKLIMFQDNWQHGSRYLEKHLYVRYDQLSEFIEAAWNDIIPVVCVDTDWGKANCKTFCMRHKEYMLSFILLYKTINRNTENETIDIRCLMDLLHLYIRLKRCDIKVPTATSGYNKNTPSAALKIDTAMKRIKEEHDMKIKQQVVPDKLYRQNMIITTWLSLVMYMAIHRFTCDLLILRLKATKKIFYCLLQHIPSLINNKEKDVDYDKIIHDTLFPLCNEKNYLSSIKRVIRTLSHESKSCLSISDDKLE